MLESLSGSKAVITGAASGIGAALAQALVAEGVTVMAADIDGPGIEKAVRTWGSGAIAVQVDVADPGSVDSLADRAFSELGAVDLLFNNAGVFQGGLAWERSLEDWQWTMGVNVYGIIHGIRSFIPRMIAQDTPGHVVNTASVAAFIPGPFSSPYIVSKCAALSLSECLALDLEAVGSKIGASVLTPSAFDTGIAHTARIRNDTFGTDATPDGKMTVEALAALTSAGMQPEEAVAPVLDAIRDGTFLIPTKPSYATQIKSRSDALIDRRVPPLPEVD